MKTIGKLVLYVCFAINTSSLFAQTTFQFKTGRNDHDHGTRVISTYDGAYVVAATVRSLNSIVITKLDTHGDTLWMRRYRGSDPNFYLSGICQTSDSGFAVSATIIFDNGGPFYFWYIWLMKLDPQGSVSWTRTYGEWGLDDYVYSIIPTSDNGFMLAGRTRSGITTTAGYRGFLLKLDSIGNQAESRVFDGWAVSQFSDVKSTPEGGYIAVGYVHSYEAAQEDIYLVKTDANGDTLWTRTFGSTGRDWGRGVELDPSGGYILTGTSTSFGSGNEDIVAMKVDENGTLVWANSYGGTQKYIATASTQMPNGEIAVTGFTEGWGATGSDMFVLKINTNGVLLSAFRYDEPGDQSGVSIDATHDSGLIIGGTTYDSIGAQKLNIYVWKTHPSNSMACNYMPFQPSVMAITPEQGGGAELSSFPFSFNNSRVTQVFNLPMEYNHTCRTVVGLEENSLLNSFRVYPNPSTGIIWLSDIRETGPVVVSIFDMKGKLIFHQRHQSSDPIRLDLSQSPTGIYSLVLSQNDKLAVSKIQLIPK